MPGSPQHKKPRRAAPSFEDSPNDACIVGYARTPIGNFQGGLSSLSAVELGAIVIKEALKRANVPATRVEEVFMGNVLSANVGQAPARQAALKAGLPVSVPCTTVNKVCSSGMKAIMFAAQSIMLGQNTVVVAGGMESMSNTPYYADKMRGGARYGNVTMIDGIQRDGLSDAETGELMGLAGELCAEEHKISREAQDRYAEESYRRALNATKSGCFEGEIVPVEIPQKKGPSKVVKEDEEVVAREVSLAGLAKLPTPFKKDGTVTSGNASPLSDGAAALVLVSRSTAEELGLNIHGVVRGFGDAAKTPNRFTTAPALAIPKALKMANIAKEDIEYFEINEAFSSVALANTALLALDPKRVNVHGGAVSIGHPLGVSGARIVMALCNILEKNGARLGAAAVCNGGGGASAMIIEAQAKS